MRGHDVESGGPSDERTRTVPVVLGLTTGVIVVAMLPWSIGFYTLVRLLVTAGVGWVIFAGRTYGTSPPATIALVVVGLVFNPIVPVYLDRGTWLALDIVAAGSLGWVWLQLRDYVNPQM